MTGTLSWHRSGPASAPAVLWIHGFLGCGSDWRAMIAALPDYQHLTVDLPGHGDSPALSSDRPAIELVCAQILATVEAAGLRGAPLSVVGYSLGARVAMALLGHLSQHLKQAILISGHPGLDEPD
ncbi:MAG: alpha/beta fold hydrolase, partial [Myxococcales bacterium]|nr:alpha/beta fold hydrolase [Myxococcales bacterium]